MHSLQSTNWQNEFFQCGECGDWNQRCARCPVARCMPRRVATHIMQRTNVNSLSTNRKIQKANMHDRWLETKQQRQRSASAWINRQKRFSCPEFGFGMRNREQSKGVNWPSRPCRFRKRENRSAIPLEIFPVPLIRVPKSESLNLPPRTSLIRPWTR